LLQRYLITRDYFTRCINSKERMRCFH
jgi:hypothetical protein